MSALHWHVGDVSAPNMVRTRHRQVSQQIRVFAVRSIRDAGALATVNGLVAIRVSLAHHVDFALFA